MIQLGVMENKFYLSKHIWTSCFYFQALHNPASTWVSRLILHILCHNPCAYPILCLPKTTNLLPHVCLHKPSNPLSPVGKITSLDLSSGYTSSLNCTSTLFLVLQWWFPVLLCIIAMGALVIFPLGPWSRNPQRANKKTLSPESTAPVPSGRGASPSSTLV